MIKRTLIAVAFVCLLLLSSIAKADGLTVWGLGDYKAIDARFGYQFGGLEAGFAASRSSGSEEIEGFYGGYGIYHLPFVLDANSLPFLPIQMQTVSYLGGIAGIESEDLDYGVYGPVFGLVLNKFIVENPPLRQEEVQLVTEVQYLFYDKDVEDAVGKSEEWRFNVGLRIYFPRE